MPEGELILIGQRGKRVWDATERLASFHVRVDGAVDDFCAACDAAWPCDTMLVVGVARRAVLESGDRVREGDDGRR